MDIELYVLLAVATPVNKTQSITEVQSDMPPRNNRRICISTAYEPTCTHSAPVCIQLNKRRLAAVDGGVECLRCEIKHTLNSKGNKHVYKQNIFCSPSVASATTQEQHTSTGSDGDAANTEVMSTLAARRRHRPLLEGAVGCAMLPVLPGEET